jgi:signal transduction histidine kinase
MADRNQHADQAGGLARTISVVGLAISQAADELQQAAERLIAAEEQARDADLRTQAAEEQLAQSAGKISELLTMVEAARDQAAEADERARRAEAELRAAIEQARELEQQVQAMERRVRELEPDAARAAELERQLGELRARLEEAEARPTVIVDEEHGALKEAIAAEVRRPLTSILGITLALKHTDSRSPDGREMIRQLATHARKLDRLVGEMLEIDRIAAGTYVPNVRRTDLEALVRRVAEESSDLANRDVELRTDHVAIHVDPGLTEQMVETLLANAGRRTVPGSTVWISVSAEEGGAVIAVEDTGPEVPAGVRQALLADGDPGMRERAKGAAGLSLLSRLAELHGGRCWVEDRSGGGASFRVFLPDGASLRDREPGREPRTEVARPPRELDERALALARALREPVEDEELPV